MLEGKSVTLTILLVQEYETFQLPWQPSDIVEKAY